MRISEEVKAHQRRKRRKRAAEHRRTLAAKQAKPRRAPVTRCKAAECPHNPPTAKRQPDVYAPAEVWRDGWQDHVSKSLIR